MSKTRAYIYICIAMVIWATSYLFSQVALRTFNPVTTVTMRIFIATLLLYVIGKFSGKLQKIENRTDFITLLIAGFSQPFCYFICEAYGLSMMNAAVASVILSTIPLFSPLFSYIFVRERISWYNIVGIIVSSVGVAMVVLDGTRLDVPIKGFLFLMLAVLSAVMYTVMLKRVPIKYSSVTTIFYVHLFSLIFFIPTFLLVDVKYISDIEFSWKAIGCIFVLAAFASVLGYVLFCQVIRVIGVTKSNAFNNVQPAITAIAVWIIFGEVLPLIKVVGIVVVIIGLFVSQINLKKQNVSIDKINKK